MAIGLNCQPQSDNEKLGITCECLLPLFKNLLSGLEERELCFQQKPAPGCPHPPTYVFELCISPLLSHTLLLPESASAVLKEAQLLNKHVPFFSFCFCFFFLLFFGFIFNQKCFHTQIFPSLSSSHHMQYGQVLMEVTLSLKKQCYLEQCIRDQSKFKIKK